jgi:mRNA-degrading endonuclease RelE of RelBE toxin-antitoxin system
MYYVKIKDVVIKFLNRLPRDRKEKIWKKINLLGENPDIGDYIDREKTKILMELKEGSHRIYYTIENEFVVINEISYEGQVNVDRAGNKNTQTRDIEYMRKNLR